MIDKEFAKVRDLGTLIFIFLCYALFNSLGVAGAFFLDNQFVGFAVAGGVLGQVGLLTVWAVIGTQPVWVRLLSTSCMAVVLFNIISLAIFLTEGRANDIEPFLRANLGLPVVLLAAAFPIWLASIFLGWRIIHPDTDDGLDGDRRFGIRGILIGMAVIGVALSLAPYATSEEMGPEANWVMLATSAAFICIWQILFVAPATVLALLHKHTFGTVAALLGYFWVMFALAIGLILLASGGVSFEGVGAMACFLFGSISTFVTALILWRAMGFVLEIRLGVVGTTPFGNSGSPFVAPAGAETPRPRPSDGAGVKNLFMMDEPKVDSRGG